MSHLGFPLYSVTTKLWLLGSSPWLATTECRSMLLQHHQLTTNDDNNNNYNYDKCDLLFTWDLIMIFFLYQLEMSIVASTVSSQQFLSLTSF